ncbi:carboxypeptidase-like regulatory domain-containing protein [Occallatibacter riparius]|uniref:Carboxypeptidase-like regulatory domain-containing protein n=1 Tax=Occallatibacter riparius TaxID=1002689 RepID=A0A9J7BNJ4_9BACT|nr:carboxypeptidase-like regulatory domain-containing protein [Occallatibacter riparius]UWZ84089.1 carboxypeptidase-like regulatory domain-containing protein [Occallatibacter riparius]
MGTVPALASGPSSVTGVVRNTAGVPQIGAVVQLLRPDLSVVASVYTNSKGRYSFATVVPGRYAVKAMGTSFLPSLRENVRVQTSIVVNMTLNTLYEVMQWLPAQPRSADASRDDWKWTLRSAANRPLLRWLEDGPLVVVSDGRSKPKLKARLLATGGAGTFSEDGQRIAMEVEDTPSDSRELLARVDFAPGTDGSMESMLGFRQDLGFAGAVQSVAAVTIHPEVEGVGAGGLNEATLRTWEDINMGDEFQVQAGGQQVMARFAQDSPNTVTAALPFVSVGWRKGDGMVSYRFATAVPDTRGLAETQAGAWMPAVAMRDGRLTLEHGIHQEIGWERRTDDSGFAVFFYSDTLSNPVVEGMAHGVAPAGPNVLYDGSSGLVRTATSGYSSTGVVATVERRLPRGNHVRVSYANGDALVMQAQQHATPLSQLISSAHPRRAQMYSLSLSGTLDGTGTRWRASYRWQPEDTVTRIAPYALEAEQPYLNIHLRQPVYAGHDSARSLDAMIDIRNLLAQGQHPFVLTDGSLLVFAQDQRGVTAGLAFTF